MTQEQYKRAVEISERIRGLKEVKKEITGTFEHRLSYSYFSNGWRLCSPEVMLPIDDILNKHDLMIRQEIDEELRRLETEIETL